MDWRHWRPQGSSLDPAQCLSFTLSAIPHVRWWYSVLQLLSNFWNSTTSSSTVVVYWLPCQVLRIYASLRLQLNPSKIEFIWFGSRTNLLKMNTQLPITPGLWLSSRLLRSRSRPRRILWQRDVHETSRQQNRIASACFYHIVDYARFVTLSAEKSRRNWWHRSCSVVWTIVTLFLPAFPRRR